MPDLSYDQAMAFWFGLINYEQRTPEPADLKLDRMRALLKHLGNPHERLRVVHVAGSKGKGSTSALLASILREAGYRVGLFTSPHLSRVEERIQSDGIAIAPAELTSLLAEIHDAVEHLGEQERGQHPTFFEVATALGFLHFVRRRVDVAVLEVGLGGRFDSTNVCRPLVSIITSISFDHTKQLGNTLARIAAEKAGIVKPGRPTISGVTVPEARQVIETVCHNVRSPLQQLGVDFRYGYEPGQVENLLSTQHSALSTCSRVQITTPSRSWPWMQLGLLGDHQAANAALAVACVEHLRIEGLNIPDRAVADGLANVRWPARMEVLGQRPLVVLDCAHNVASAQALVETLRASFPPVPRLLIFAGSSDKDLAGMFRVLAPHFRHVFLTRYAHSPRSVPPEQLAELLRHVSPVPISIFPTTPEAWQAARSAAKADELICITGSVFLAGELRPLLRHNQQPEPP